MTPAWRPAASSLRPLLTPSFGFRSSILRASLTTRNDDASATVEEGEEGEGAAKKAGGRTRLNPLVTQIKPSKTVEIFSLVKQMQSEGVDVTSLCVGEPDYLPPQSVLDSIANSAALGETRYTAVTGTADIREAISDDLRRRKNVSYDPQTQIVVGNGAKQCVYQAIMAVAGAGDVVLIPAPYWPSYPEMSVLAGAEPVIVPSRAEAGYLLSAGELRSAIEANPRAKVLVICNPSNPTGHVYDEQHLEEIVSVLRDYPDIIVVADEIYERLVYDDDVVDDDDLKDPDKVVASCPSVASYDGMYDRTVTINGFSKSYAMTGLRLGYVVGPVDIIRCVTTVQSQLTSCAGSISQAAGVTALTKVSDAELNEKLAVMNEKRRYTIDRVTNIPGLKLAARPNGAFYVLPDISEFTDEGDGFDDTALCLDMLQRTKLALVPGSSFGAPNTVRISYANDMDTLELGMKKLRDYFVDLRDRQQKEREGQNP